MFIIRVDFDDDLGSEEESGKDWSELEEEAAEGELWLCSFFVFPVFFVLDFFPYLYFGHLFVCWIRLLICSFVLFAYFFCFICLFLLYLFFTLCIGLSAISFLSPRIYDELFYVSVNL